MPKYLLLKHYRGGPEPHRPVPTMDQWAPEDVEAHIAFQNHVSELLEENAALLAALWAEAQVWLGADLDYVVPQIHVSPLQEDDLAPAQPSEDRELSDGCKVRRACIEKRCNFVGKQPALGFRAQLRRFDRLGRVSRMRPCF